MNPGRYRSPSSPATADNQSEGSAYSRRVHGMLSGAATCLAILSAAGGCFGPAPRPAARPGASEPTLAEQAEEVRQGRSDVVRLDRTTVRDDDLAALDGLNDNLRRVNFSKTEISNSGLARLCALEGLEQLRLSSPRVTNSGLEPVGRLQRLRFLHLLDMPITDSGLEHLHSLTNLESLYLDRTQVSDEGIARLIEALPEVHLHVDEHHHRLDPHAQEHAH